MRNLFFVCLLVVFAGTQANAQGLQFGIIKDNGQTLRNIPRFSWSIPFYLKKRLGPNIAFHSGLILKNQGVIYDQGGDRLKKRLITLGPEIGITGLIDGTLVYKFGFGLDYGIHYKEKVFPNGVRRDKVVTVSESWSNRVRQLNLSLSAGIGIVPGIMIYGEYFLFDFMNKDFTETINGTVVRPYQNLDITRFNIGITFLYIDEDDE